jgi:hypothetical protein
MTLLTSSRFAGNAVLESIRQDPDTGTKKLQKHSDVEAVRLVQEAIYDLNWAQPFPGEEGYPARSKFVDGDYGPTTTGSVTAFKSHYRIVFPPGSPTGVIDGFVGPRTLERLDRQIAHRDEMLDVFTDKVGELQQAGLPVRLFAIDDEPPPLVPWLGSGRYMRWWTNWGSDAELETGILVGSSREDVFEVHGPVFRRWWELDGCTGRYGPPTSDVKPDGSGGYVSTFAHGEIAVDGAGNVVERPSPVAYVPPPSDQALV